MFSSDSDRKILRPQRLIQRPSGLWMPADVERQPEGPAQLILPPSSVPENVLFVVGRPPSDLDAVFFAPDPEALGVSGLSLDEIRELVATVRVAPAIFGVSGIAAGTWSQVWTRRRTCGLPRKCSASG